MEHVFFAILRLMPNGAQGSAAVTTGCWAVGSEREEVCSFAAADIRGIGLW